MTILAIIYFALIAPQQPAHSLYEEELFEQDQAFFTCAPTLWSQHRTHKKIKVKSSEDLLFNIGLTLKQLPSQVLDFTSNNLFHYRLCHTLAGDRGPPAA